ncbi:MAG: HAD family hydrolase [Clostridiales bacterium]|nr:HAD family hydrolase [Clostridiales bacterium]
MDREGHTALRNSENRYGNKAVFLDRDGLINRQAPPHQYITKWEEFEFLPGVPEAIHKLNKAGYLVLIVTNQRGIARGMMTVEAVEKIHRQMCKNLNKIGAHIDGIYVCPHNAGECHCRKPDIGLFLRAERDFRIDKETSWMVGDSESDVQAGQNYGVRTIRTTCLEEAAEKILGKGILPKEGISPTNSI